MPPTRVRFLASACFLAVLASGARAEFSPPRLASVFPPGAQQGTELTVEVQGNALDGPTALYFSHPGIRGDLVSADAPKDEKAKEKDKEKEKGGRRGSDGKGVRFKVHVAPDVPPGDYDVRFSGKEGISNPRTFVVSDYAEALETEPNNEKKDANRIALNVTVNGRIGASEDVDWFVFPAKKGQRVLIDCRAWRIDSRLDGFMWLYDAQGKQLAQSQDEDLRDEKRDPFIDVEVPEDGDYYVKLTDFTYNGGGDYFYRLSVTTLPYIDFILPPSIPAGTASTVTIYGRNLPGGEACDQRIKNRPLQTLRREIHPPEGEAGRVDLRFSGLVRPWSSILDGMEVRVKGEGGSSNGKLLRFTPLAAIVPSEAAHQREKAQRLALPASVAGQFGREGPDYYVFAAKKDEKVTIEVFSNRIGSPADPDMEILKADGANLASVQDWGENIGQLRFTSNTRDITHVFSAPADGDYVLRLEHLFRQAQGGPQYVYQLEVVRDAEPDYRLICSPPDEIKVDSHLLYQGGRTRLDILVWREHGLTEPITVEAKNLPPGVTADPFVIGKDLKWGTLTLQAAPEAALGDSVFEIVGTSEVKGKTLVRKARGGVIVWDTVNTPALSRMTQSIVLGVRPKAPFTLTVSPAEVRVQKGDSFELRAVLVRGEGMTAAVQVNGAGYQLPPGLTIPVKTIDAGQTEVKLSVATDKMPEGTFSFIVNGDGQVPSAADKGKNIRCVYPSNPVRIIVEPKAAKDGASKDGKKAAVGEKPPPK
ncbi:MAG TPA: PPC domain-containing protein [Planctomycetota bacterium]|nr:PPC domain-containing protein [Planctomycetota bacterium]